MRAVNRFQRRLKRGEHFPAFMFISVTDRCNLSCQGCWVTPATPSRELSVNEIDDIVTTCKTKGAYFFGILGGEPLLHRGIFEVFERHPEAYFLLFTNGLLITDAVAARMRKAGNVSPLISVEGSSTVSDARRGGKDVYARTMRGLEACRRHRLVIGVATSVCKSNLDDLATAAFVREVAARGAHYLWYYIYRPVGPNPCPELTLDPPEIKRLRQFLVDIRQTAPLMIVDAYWDHEGKALCPAAVGIGHHIGPGGDVEPCPPLQFAMENVCDDGNWCATVSQSHFLEEFRELACETTQGCIIMEAPHKLEQFLRENGVRDTTGRGSGLAELAAMQPHMSQHMPGQEIPEKSGAYRFAKKHWFFGFGAYG